MGRSSSGQDIRLSNGEHGFESRTPYQADCGRVAQWESAGLSIRVLRVRVPSRPPAFRRRWLDPLPKPLKDLVRQTPDKAPFDFDVFWAWPEGADIYTRCNIRHFGLLNALRRFKHEFPLWAESVELGKAADRG